VLLNSCIPTIFSGQEIYCEKIRASLITYEGLKTSLKKSKEALRDVILNEYPGTIEEQLPKFY
jgi:hypothetical protein